MGILDRLGRLIRANVNDLIDKAEDPEKVLEQAIRDMGDELVKMRQAVAQAIAALKRTEQQYKKNLEEAERWQQRAQLALSKGEEGLAREALVRKKTYADAAAELKPQLDSQREQVEALRRNLAALESKIAEAKTKKDMLKARLSAAKANQQLQGVMSNIGKSTAMEAFERMEEKVLQMEAQSQAVGELAGMGEENKWLALESGSEIEDELARLKAQISGSSPAPSLPSSSSTTSSTTTSSTTTSDIDYELEQLKRELGKS